MMLQHFLPPVGRACLPPTVFWRLLFLFSPIVFVFWRHCSASGCGGIQYSVRCVDNRPRDHQGEQLLLCRRVRHTYVSHKSGHCMGNCLHRICLFLKFRRIQKWRKHKKEKYAENGKFGPRLFVQHGPYERISAHQLLVVCKRLGVLLFYPNTQNPSS